MNTKPDAVSSGKSHPRWRWGTPPKDGKCYDMAQRVRNAGGQLTTVQLATPGWWDGSTFVSHNQFSGGTRPFVPPPNRWRPAS